MTITVEGTASVAGAVKVHELLMPAGAMLWRDEPWQHMHPADAADMRRMGPLVTVVDYPDREKTPDLIRVTTWQAAGQAAGQEGEA